MSFNDLQEFESRRRTGGEVFDELRLRDCFRSTVGFVLGDLLEDCRRSFLGLLLLSKKVLYQQ